MSRARRIGITLIAVLTMAAALDVAVHSQRARPQNPQSKLPNPYRLVEGWPTLPTSMNGGRWGELIRADLDPRGNIWVFHRCFNTEPAGAATCVGRSEPPVLQFDPSGKLLSSFGGGAFAFPHDMGTIYAADVGTHKLRKYIKVR